MGTKIEGKVPATREQAARQPWLTLAAVCTAFFMLSVNNTLVNVALPTIQRAFNVPTASLEWILNGYALTLAVLVVTMGKLGDLFGRKRLFLIGMGIFTAASLASSFAPNLPAVIACRIGQGIGGAIVMPATLSIITATFHGRARATAIAFWTSVGGMAIIAGPILGGLLVQYLSWRWIFFINVPVSALVFVLTLRYMGESYDTARGGTVDLAGVATLSPALFALTLALIEGQGWGWTSGRILGLCAFGVACLVAFFIVEQRQSHPMVDFALFRSQQFAVANLINLVYLFGIYGLLFFMTLYMQGVLGYSALQAGLHTMPLGLMAFGAPLGARLVDRFGPRPVLIAGIGCVSAALILVSQRLTPGAAYATFLPSFVLVGCGAGLISPPSSTIAMGAVPHTKAGVASGILNMTRQLGSVLGIAVLGAIYAARARAHIGDALVGLPLPDALKASAATEQGARALTAQLDPALGASVRGAIARGTVQAYNDALLIAGLVCGCGVLLTLLLPTTSPNARAEESPAPETVRAETPQSAPATS